MKGWYYIAAYLTAQLPDATHTFPLRMLASRLGVDQETALVMVGAWLEAVTAARCGRGGGGACGLSTSRAYSRRSISSSTSTRQLDNSAAKRYNVIDRFRYETGQGQHG